MDSHDDEVEVADDVVGTVVHHVDGDGGEEHARDTTDDEQSDASGREQQQPHETDPTVVHPRLPGTAVGRSPAGVPGRELYQIGVGVITSSVQSFRQEIAERALESGGPLSVERRVARVR